MTITRTEQTYVHRFEVIDTLMPGKALWDLYHESMLPLATLAAQRHVLTEKEFNDILRDRRIAKYLAVREGVPLGLGVMTDDLDAWPLISPSYYRVRFGDRPVFYVGFILVEKRSMGVLSVLIDAMSKPIRQARGIAAMDFSAYRLTEDRIGLHLGQLFKHLDPAAELVDTDRQEFHAWSFGGQD